MGASAFLGQGARRGSLAKAVCSVRSHGPWAQRTWDPHKTPPSQRPWRSSDSMSALLRSAFLVLLVWPAVAALDDQQRRQQAEVEAAREAAAQKALTDSLTDALALLRHGSARSKEMAAANIANMAIETTISQPFHPVTFRNACVRAGILDELVEILRGAPESATMQGQVHALAALESIATDDPNTELDNGHALAACEAGTVPPTVQLLGSPEEALHVGAAALAAVLAENPQCQTLLLTAGAVAPLIGLGALPPPRRHRCVPPTSAALRRTPRRPGTQCIHVGHPHSAPTQCPHSVPTQRTLTVRAPSKTREDARRHEQT
jgi:hypothetical protein